MYIQLVVAEQGSGVGGVTVISSAAVAKKHMLLEINVSCKRHHL
jgi:hypothetical protein